FVQYGLDGLRIGQCNTVIGADRDDICTTCNSSGHKHFRIDSNAGIDDIDFHSFQCLLDEIFTVLVDVGGSDTQGNRPRLDKWALRRHPMISFLVEFTGPFGMDEWFTTACRFDTGTEKSFHTLWPHAAYRQQKRGRIL